MSDRHFSGAHTPFHMPCPSEQFGDTRMAISIAAPQARYFRPTREHAHSGYLLFFPLRDGKRLEVAGHSEHVREDSLAFLPPGLMHRTLQGSGSPEHMALHMDHALFEREFALYQADLGLLRDFTVLSVGGDELLGLLQRFIRESRGGLPGKEVVQNALMLQIAHTAIRRLVHRGGSPACLPDNRALRHVLLFVEANLQRPVSVARLAREANMSESSLNRLFRRELGTTPAGYLLEARLQRARHLLGNGFHTVTQVAFACGFGSSAYFSTRFKQRFGCTPKQFVGASRHSVTG